MYDLDWISMVLWEFLNQIGSHINWSDGRNISFAIIQWEKEDGSGDFVLQASLEWHTALRSQVTMHQQFFNDTRIWPQCRLSLSSCVSNHVST